MEFISDWLKKLFETNLKLKSILKDYSLYSISGTTENDQTNLAKINESEKLHLKESKVMIIYRHTCKDRNNIFTISFKNTIIAVNQIYLRNLDDFFSNCSNIKIYYFFYKSLEKSDDFASDYPNIKENTVYSFTSQNDFHISDIITKNLDQYKISDRFFFEEIESFYINVRPILNKFKAITDTWDIIGPSISGYLIQQSYIKLKEKAKTNELKEQIEDKDYIKLRILGRGTFFQVELIYHIERSELFAIKIPIENNDTQKLIDRELKNYQKLQNLDFPLLPKYYGLGKERKFIVIQFINGQTLEEIESIDLNENDKITIIYELMVIVEFLHTNNFVYRDLKPNNVIIDENKNVFLIDFDRMIEFTDTTEEFNHTISFLHNYISPEILLGKITYKSDVYSIGQMIYYLFKNKKPPLEANEEITPDAKYIHFHRKIRNYASIYF